MVVLLAPFAFGLYMRMYCCRRGSTQVVVRVLWSTKYGRPSGVARCSHPGGSPPLPCVVFPVNTMVEDAEFELPLGGVCACC